MQNLAYQLSTSNTSDFSTFGPARLRQIEWTAFQLFGAQAMSPRARRYLSFFVSAAKMGARTVRVSLPELADIIYRAQGQTASVRTLRYALAELETLGYVRRRVNRTGADRAVSVIELSSARFAYWTRKSDGNVEPLPTREHLSPYRQNMPGNTVTSTNNRVNNDNYLESDNNKLVRVDTVGKYAGWIHPILFTLRMVLWGPRSAPKPLSANPDRKAIYQFAVAELAPETPCRSTVDWKRWERDWQNLPIDEREGITRTLLIPAIRDTIPESRLSPSGGRDSCLPNPPRKQPSGRRSFSHPIEPGPAATAAAGPGFLQVDSGAHVGELLREYFSRQAGAHENGAEKSGAPADAMPARRAESLSIAELEILKRAREAVKNRV